MERCQRVARARQIQSQAMNEAMEASMCQDFTKGMVRLLHSSHAAQVASHSNLRPVLVLSQAWPMQEWGSLWSKIG